MARIKGTRADDNLVGTTGRDRIDGRQGDDHLWGNGGNDTFVFQNVPHKNFGNDVIHDFNAGDNIVFNHYDDWSALQAGSDVVISVDPGRSGDDYTVTVLGVNIDTVLAGIIG